jgi:hypothetical protein
VCLHQRQWRGRAYVPVGLFTGECSTLAVAAGAGINRTLCDLRGAIYSSCCSPLRTGLVWASQPVPGVAAGTVSQLLAGEPAYQCANCLGLVIVGGCRPAEGFTGATWSISGEVAPAGEPVRRC